MILQTISYLQAIIYFFISQLLNLRYTVGQSVEAGQDYRHSFTPTWQHIATTKPGGRSVKTSDATPQVRFF